MYEHRDQQSVLNRVDPTTLQIPSILSITTILTRRFNRYVR